MGCSHDGAHGQQLVPEYKATYVINVSPDTLVRFIDSKNNVLQNFDHQGTKVLTGHRIMLSKGELEDAATRPVTIGIP